MGTWSPPSGAHRGAGKAARRERGPGPRRGRGAGAVAPGHPSAVRARGCGGTAGGVPGRCGQRSARARRSRAVCRVRRAPGVGGERSAQEEGRAVPGPRPVPRLRGLGPLPLGRSQLEKVVGPQAASRHRRSLMRPSGGHGTCVTCLRGSGRGLGAPGFLHCRGSWNWALI